MITKLPCPLQVPTLPDIQAIWSPVHGDEKLSVEKRLLYPLASARFAAKSAGDTVAVADGVDWMIVGAVDIVTDELAIMEVVEGIVLEVVCVDTLEAVLLEEPVADDFVVEEGS